MARGARSKQQDADHMVGVPARAQNATTGSHAREQRTASGARRSKTLKRFQLSRGWTVYQNPDGRLVLRRPHPKSGRRTTVTLRDGDVPVVTWEHAVRVAEEIFRQHRLHLERVAFGVASSSGDTSVRAVLAEYREHLAALRRSEFLKEGRRDRLLEGLVLLAAACAQSSNPRVQALMDFNLAAVNIDVVRLWLAACREAVHVDRRKGFAPRPYSEAQMVKVTEALDSFLAFAATKTNVPSPLRAAGLVGLARETHREAVRERRGEAPLHWGIEQATAIYEDLLGTRIDGPDAEDVMILLLLLTGGLRYSEAASLTWGQLDFAQRLLTVRTLKRSKKKGGGLRGNAPAKRQVPFIPAAVWERLALYRDLRRAVPPDGRVFPRAWARARADGDSCRANYEYLDRVFARCGYTRPLGRGYHAPRHTVISVLPYVCKAVPDLESGRMVASTPYAADEIQRIVGHSVGSPTTMRTYAHLFEGLTAPVGTITTVDWTAIYAAYRRALMVRAAAVEAEGKESKNVPPLAGSPTMVAKLTGMQQDEAA